MTTTGTTEPITDGERWHRDQSEIAGLIARGEWPHDEMRLLRQIELGDRSIADARGKLAVLAEA